MADAIVSEPLNPRDGFNWVFLVELLISGILTVFFLFYFNRLFATLVSYGIRAYTWHNFHAYIDIQALQISLLGGRIFFKDIRYHGHNETILVHGGYITWQYWLRRVKDADLYSDTKGPVDQDGSSSPSTHGSRSSARERSMDSAEKGGKQTPKKLPCRFSVKVSGVEAFMYNRSPAYDGIIDAVRRKASGASEDSQAVSVQSSGSSNTPQDGLHDEKHGVNRAAGPSDATRVDTEHSAAPKTRPDDPPSFLRLLPIRFECNKGAIVVGNEHTASVITAQFEKASGEFDASKSGPLDVYQQVFNFQFQHPIVHMKPNHDFKSPQLETAARIKQEEDHGMEGPVDEKHENKKRSTTGKQGIGGLFHLFGRFSKSTDSIHTHPASSAGKKKSPFASTIHVPGQERWRGLTRYLDESQSGGHEEWNDVEYAKSSLIADCPCINVSFYWDVTGPVPSELENSMHVSPSHPQDINGSAPPEYGMDIQVHGGTINYGPWTDRHRAVFQNIFFPGSHVDGVPAAPLNTGDLRVLSLFKLFLSIEDDTILRIPIREPSKDWKWKGKANTLAGHGRQGPDRVRGKGKARRKHMRAKGRDTSASSANVRPFAWIDVKVAGNSSVSYVMDMVASKNGFQNRLKVDIASTEISSSVNHGLLWRSGGIGLDCDLSNPIEWNTLRNWTFNISCRNLELFLLRDHLFLLTDLVADWGSGPPSDYFTFVPFQYNLNVDFIDFKLYLNTNDANIVNNPVDLDDNNFIILLGQRLRGAVLIPLDRYKPVQNEIRFDVQGEDIGLEVSMPSKNTLNTFVLSNNVATLGGLSLKGSHTYMTETSYTNTDRLFMGICGSRLSLELYGWLVHHFMKIKDNYFGDDMHFKTLEEFQGLPKPTLATDATIPNGQALKQSNDLDVVLCISAEQSSVWLPSNLYSAKKSLRADVPYVSADLRFTNYYMDLMVNFSPISIGLGGSMLSPGLPNDVGGQTEVFIDSVVIAGHRLFGLPPTEPTYVCNWDFDIGRISGECTADLIETAAGAGRSFGFTFDDDENTLPISNAPIIHDATFLRLKTDVIHLWFHVAKEALLFSTGPINVAFNDLAGHMFSQRMNARIPDLVISSVDARSASRHRTRAGEKQLVETHAFLQTSLCIDMFKRKLEFSEDRNRQQAYMQLHDQRANRTPFMFIDIPHSSIHYDTKNQESVRPPAMQFPELPHPLYLSNTRHGEDSSSLASSAGYAKPGATRGRPRVARLSKSTSKASLTSSIQASHKNQTQGNALSSSQSRTLIDRSVSRTNSSDRYYHLTPDDERRRRNLPPSSVALSSSLVAPYFPLDHVAPDLTDVPQFPTIPPELEDDDNAGDYVFNDVSTNHLDESFDHTSLLISSDPGIRLYCTPQFIRSIADLVELIQPCQPEDLLDEFQVQVMTKILDIQKRREGKGKSLEFNVRVPFMHTRLHNEFVNHPQFGGGKDQYDIILNQLKTATRIKSFPGDRAGEDILSLHTTLGSLGVSITEKTRDGPQDDVAVQLEIKELLVWMLKNKESSINITFRTLEAATASKKVEYLASLIHRTTLLGNELVTSFASVVDAHRMRLQYFAWFLTMVHEQFPDPSFLTKASYALRATRDHLRSHDSWKIISRFRYVWQSLEDQERSELVGNCTQKILTCPDGAEERVITMWDQWRTWDLAHVKKSLAMRLLFGTVTDEESINPPGPLYVDVRSQGMKLIADPGPSQSEAALWILALNIAIVPPPPPSGLMLVDSDIRKKTTTVQLNSRATSVRFSWEICELIEILIKMFQKESLERPKPPGHGRLDLPKEENEDHDFHFIYVTDKAKIMLDTINLRGVSKGQRFRVSVAGSNNKSSGEGAAITVLAHFEQGVMELLSRSRLLLRSQFDSPSIYFSQHQSEGSSPQEINVAGASRMIKVEVKQDILGFIEVVDTVLRDEVAYFHEQVRLFKQSAKQTPKDIVAKNMDTNTQLPNITLALFMDAYSINIALVQSLTWSIVGSSGRISVAPSLGKHVTLRVDYDLAAHTHCMYSNSSEGSGLVSSLGMPPVNGRVSITNTDKDVRISAAGIIERIELQASELQALVATINRPEIVNVMHAIREDVEVLQSHIKELLPEEEKSLVTKPPEPARDVIFDVRMTLSGLDILASTPEQPSKTTIATLAVRLGCVQLKATNSGPNNKILTLPEAVAHLQAITVEMTLSDSGKIRNCGNLTIGATFQATARKQKGSSTRLFRVQSTGLEVNAYADTASAVVDVMNHLQDKLKELDLSREKEYLRRLRSRRSRIAQTRGKKEFADDNESTSSGALFTSMYAIELRSIQLSWIVGTSVPAYHHMETEDLVLSFKRVNLTTSTGDVARLMIEDMQLQTVPNSANKWKRSLNSALLPKVEFKVSYSSTRDSRKVAFQAAGKALDIQLDSRFILPVNSIERSIAIAGKKFRNASANWNTTPTTSGSPRKNPFGNKRLELLLVEANFAGAVVHINGNDTADRGIEKESRSQQKGRYSQFVGDGSKSSMVLRAPAIALKVEYKDNGHDPSLNAELRIDGSNNTLYPTVVPLLIDISDSIKEVVRKKDEESNDGEESPETQSKPAAKLLEEDNLITADPSALLGRTRLNLGLRICKQEFSLSCQPIARVAAIAKLEDIYVTVNSVKSQEHGHFFAASAAFEKLQASVQHVYSRESTFGFDVDSIVLSLMNSKHLSGTSGISAILKVDPVALQVNARQLQDFLLFREIWIPPEIREPSKPPTTNANSEPGEYLMQRYQQVTAATAFPWNANVSFTKLSIDLDLGQAIGKTTLQIHNLWASSKKNTDWEQNLCVGIENVGVESGGRTSGFVELKNVKVRTSISWPSQELGIQQAPLVQASVGFGQLRVKAGFDYQAFVIADIANFDFLMYNVRDQLKGGPDRLVAILDGDKVHVFCTATSAAQGVALSQAIERLVQENQQAYKQSLKDIEKFLRRKSSVASPFARTPSQSQLTTKPDDDTLKTPISLHTDVVVTLRSLNLGVFPSTFVDTQIFMLEAADAQARFAVALENNNIHSALGLTLGKLSVALSSVPSPKRSKPVGELTVEDVVESARSARGGTILRVPKVIATMHTWQVPKSEKIDYIFKSSLEGKVDVGWNYSRISFIRTMWGNHSRTLASRLGKPLPESNIKITSSSSSSSQQHAPGSSAAENEGRDKETENNTAQNALKNAKDKITSTSPPTSPSTSQEKDSAHPPPSSSSNSKPTTPAQEKITAEIKVPQSRYTYTPLEPPLIETPQLRDMGEATPPLEWIGLHRDRLPNVTHQIVIVTLLEVAREVEDAYKRILGE
ncbi:hypothetical protein K491DRAFT_690313 [Lophiostoma macrostomum CBS 122681]|uniref:Fermentation associated protein n=1 Tax=Lophiostoma macrostomum CBS 122681 TaxID=1314788 RepID=A0A6A6TFG4_9PLEO|nr:hypothetical protein K491DRAFT_690313 [Lophiostoma macrostomum CBS 122681]